MKAVNIVIGFYIILILLVGDDNKEKPNTSDTVSFSIRNEERKGQERENIMIWWGQSTFRTHPCLNIFIKFHAYPFKINNKFIIIFIYFTLFN